MKATSDAHRPFTTYLIVLIAMMVLTLVLLSAVALNAVDRADRAHHSDHLQIAQIRAETFSLFAAGTLVMSLALAQLGRRLAAETRRRARLEVESDLSELRHAQEALQLSHERYRELADALPQPIFETDEAGIITFANRCAYETFGYTPRDLPRGVPAQQMIAPAERERAKRNFRRRRGGEVIANSEYEMLAADGTTFPAIIYADAIIRDGQFFGVRGTIADISDRKEEEHRLQERLLFEKAVSRASALLFSDGGSDLDSVVRAIGETLSVSHVYILRFGGQVGAAEAPHMWSDSPDTSAWTERLTRICSGALPWWMERLSAGEDVVIPDVDTLSEEAAADASVLRECGIRAAMAVPIQSASGELIGLVGFDDTAHARNWEKEEGRLLRLIASRLTIYWQRRRSEEALRLTNARLELLNSVSQRLNQGASLSDAIQHSCNGLREVLGYRYVELFLPSHSRALGGAEDGDGTFSCRSTGKLQGLNGPLIGASRFDRAFDECEPLDFTGRDEILPLICDLAPPGEDAMPDIAPQIYDILGVEYICQVPLVCEGEVLGHLAIGTTEARPLPEREKRFLTQFAEQLALICAKSRAEQALRDSEKRYRLLFNSGNDAMYVHRLGADGMPGRFLEVNDVMCSMLGYSREQLLTMSPPDIDAPEAWDNVPEMLDRLMEDGRLLFETMHLTSDERRIPVETNAHLFELDGGPVVLSIARDITGRRKSEERLRRTNECFLGFTADPVENIEKLTELCGEVLQADWTAYVRLDEDGLRRVSGWQIPDELTLPQDPTGCICDWVMHARGEGVVALADLQQSEYASTDPNVRDLGARSYMGKAVRAHDGTLGSICAFFHDEFHHTEGDERLMGIIASAIRVEEERRRVRDEREEALVELQSANRSLEMARSEAEEANRLKSEFLANTSHEIRTPLNGIIGYLQLVLNDLCDSREEEREFLEGAAESANHLLELINDVLDIAKIEAGRLRIDPQPVNIASVLADTHSLIRVQADQNALELIFRPTADDLIAVCDPERLKQVLINLLGNAIKFTPEGGTITVSVRRMEEDGAVRVEIADTGIGIAPDKLDEIFDKFVQADGSTTRQRGGTGLGLTISRRLVELMGGALGGMSDGEGRGSTFYFTLPLHRNEVEQRDRMSVTGPQTLPATDRPLVLVVEDDPLCRDYLLRLLDTCGCATLWADTADGALALLDRHVPMAVTIDYSLPAREGARLITGWDLLVELQKDERFASTALILVTGDTDVLLRRVASEELPARVRVIDKRQVPTELPEAVDRAVAVGTRPDSGRILLADDDATFCRVLERMLGQRGHEIVRVPSGRECLQYLQEHADEVSLLLLDLRMPELNGYEVLARLRTEADARNLPVLVVTAYPEPQTVDQRMLLAGGGLTRLLTKHEVLSDPTRLHRLIEQFTGAAQTGDDSDDNERPPDCAAAAG
ncbi:MAG: PAS domain S-box protein [Armatimonadota bacterium]